MNKKWNIKLKFSHHHTKMALNYYVTVTFIKKTKFVIIKHTGHVLIKKNHV